MKERGDSRNILTNEILTGLHQEPRSALSRTKAIRGKISFVTIPRRIIDVFPIRKINSFPKR